MLQRRRIAQRRPCREALRIGIELGELLVDDAEGARGSLTKQLIAKFSLDANSEPGKFGIGPGDKGGMGVGHGPGGGGHVVKAISIRTPPDMHTNGRLPAEVIQRIVRQNFGRFRVCYEAGLRGNPSLSGRVATKFVIGRDGAVNQSSDAGSDLPDQNVVACVVRSFNALSFPAPEGGVATVTYPIILNPGE